MAHPVVIVDLMADTRLKAEELTQYGTSCHCRAPCTCMCTMEGNLRTGKTGPNTRKTCLNPERVQDNIQLKGESIIQKKGW